MIKKNEYSAFTLIEIVVSITILSIIMVSVIMIFINFSDISTKSEINRAMQENIKNVVETISEDVRKNWITWVSNSLIDGCNFTLDLWWSFYKKWNKLCTWIWSDYYLAKEIVWGGYLRVYDILDCDKMSENCRIVKNWDPLTNSFVTIKDLNFYISNDYIPKVTINIIMQPSAKKWVKPNLIKENKIVFQTTISTRSY